MKEQELLLRQINVRLTLEEYEEIRSFASKEMRRLGNMARLLLTEALAARRAQVPEGPDDPAPRPRSGRHKRFVPQ